MTPQTLPASSGARAPRWLGAAFLTGALIATATATAPAPAWANGGAPPKDAAADAKPTPAAKTAPPWRHAAYDGLLKRYVHRGVVDYRGLKAKESVLDGYLGTLARTNPTALPRPERLAFWINAYNAFTLKLILGNYPGVKSIRDISGRWSGEWWNVGGRRYSLEGIENDILRARFKEPRIHFAINCASKSCPDLRSEAYAAARLEAQLTEQAFLFLRSSSKGMNAYSNPGALWGTNHYVSMSKIFSWFGGDFEAASGSVLAYVRPYVTDGNRAFLDKHKGDLTVRYLDYDWSLNGK